MIIDSHFHTSSMESKNISELPADLIGIDVGTDKDDWKERVPLLPQSKKIFMSVGSGPWALDRNDFISIEDECKAIERNIEEVSPDAIGECGIDNHWDYGTKDDQMKLFSAQAEIAQKHNLPFIIHSRNADEELIAAIENNIIPHSAVLHCFSGGIELLEKALSYGLFISFAGNLTYKANENIREAAKIVPIEKILVETDSPYLAPIPFRGKPSNPSLTEYTLAEIAELRNTEKEELKKQIEKNLYTFLGRKESIRKLVIT